MPLQLKGPLFRISAGLEDADDLIDDLRARLRADALVQQGGRLAQLPQFAYQVR